MASSAACRNATTRPLDELLNVVYYITGLTVRGDAQSVKIRILAVRASWHALRVRCRKRLHAHEVEAFEPAGQAIRVENVRQFHVAHVLRQRRGCICMALLHAKHCPFFHRKPRAHQQDA